MVDDFVFLVEVKNRKKKEGRLLDGSPPWFPHLLGFKKKERTPH